MRLIIGFVILFSLCSGLSILHLFLLEGIERKLNVFNYGRENSMNNNSTIDDMDICQDFAEMMIKDLDHEPSQAEIQTIFSECRLLLRNPKLSAGKNITISKKSLPSYNNSRLRYELIPQTQAVSESSEDTKGKKTGLSNNSSTVLHIVQNENNSTDDLKNPKRELDSGLPSPENDSWTFWGFLSRVKDTRDFSVSNLSFSFENMKKYPMLYAGIPFGNRKNFVKVDTDIGKIWTIVMPGTKWCGAGNIAAHDDDLGNYENLDKCCRAHDKCDDVMEAGETKYNLKNDSPFAVLNCKCDEELYHCLSQLDSATANAVGNIFFNLFSRRCYALDYPLVCKKKNFLFGCLEYEVDKTAEKIYQWKSAKKYNNTILNIQKIILQYNQ